MKYVVAALAVANVICAALLGFADEEAPRPDPPPLAADPIQLLAQPPDAPAARSAAATATPHRCLAAGPFENLEALAPLRRQVLAQGGQAEVFEREVAADPDFLVYIGPAASRDAARRMQKELRALGIECHIIPSGSRRNAVSVGVFTRHELATRQRRRVTAFGYDVRLVPLERRRTVYHLIVDRAVPAIDGVPLATCDEIAPAHQFL